MHTQLSPPMALLLCTPQCTHQNLAQLQRVLWSLSSHENKALGAPVASVWQKVLVFNQLVTPALSHQGGETTEHRGFP